MDILRINEAPMHDESIESYESHEYEPVTGANLNNPGEIRINIETQETKDDGTLYANADNVTLTNNAVFSAISSISFLVKKLSLFFYPGQATTMMGLLKYPDDFSKSAGLNQLWYKYTGVAASIVNNTGFRVRHSYIIEYPVPKGTFSFRVPCPGGRSVPYPREHTTTSPS